LTQNIDTESDLCTEAKRLEREAREAMADAHRKAEVENQNFKRLIGNINIG